MVDNFKKAMDVAAELSVDRIFTCHLNEGHDYVFEMDYIKAYAEETFGAIFGLKLQDSLENYLNGILFDSWNQYKEFGPS